MTTTNQFPERNEGDFRKALVRTLTNQMNQSERHHRQNLISQEGLAQQAKDNQHRTEMSVGEMLNMLMHTEEARKDDRELLLVLMERIDDRLVKIDQHLIKHDHVVIPKEESNFFEEISE